MKMVKLFEIALRVAAAAGLLLAAGGETSIAAQDGFPNPSIGGPVNDMVLQPDGKILICGSFATAGEQPRSRVARLISNGAVDTTFQDPQVVGTDSSNNHVFSIALQPDGKVIISGLFISVRGEPRNYLARLNPDGTLDAGFAPSVSSTVTAVALQSDGRIVVGGYFATVNGQTRNRMARLNSDGTLDTSFIDPLLTAVSGYPIGTIQLQSDGKILIGGYFNSVGGQSRSFAARLDSNGALDTSFNLTVSGPVEQFTFQPDGKILVSGFISSVNGQPRTGIARINSDGSLDPSLINTNIPSGSISAFGLQPDGKIVVGGSFSTISSQERRHIARLNPDGTFDPTFLDVNANFGGNFLNINSILIQPDSKVLVGGNFATIGHQPRQNLVRLLSNGTLDLPSAQTLVVTRPADTNDGVCDADCSLREAIGIANANSEGNGTAITFDPGVFGSSQTITLTLGELVIEQQRRVSFVGPGASQLTISGNNASRILRVRRDAIVSISGLTMSNGSANEGGALYIELNGIMTSVTIANTVVSNNTAGTGAGIRAAGSSTLNISNTTISGNIANSGGGIVFNTGTLTITNCTVIGNQSTSPGAAAGGINGGNSTFNLSDSLVTGNQGGGVAAGGTSTIRNTTITNNHSTVWGGGLYSGGVVNVVNSTISGNSATNSDGQGGGIVNYGTLTVTGSTVAANRAAFGAGIFTAGRLTMTGTSILNNVSSNTGGGIYNNIGGAVGVPISLNNCIVSGNSATSFAGGVQNRAGMNIDQSTISNNIAGLGGGGFFNVFQAIEPAVLRITRSTINANRSISGGGGGVQNQGGTVNLSNVTVSSNNASGGGGAFTISQSGIVNLSFTTIAFNTANVTGGIRITSGTVNANNSIIARNMGRNSGADFSGQLDSQGYNLIGDLANTTIVGDTTGNLLNINPRLDPVLRNNGGLTMTHALLVNSPALDAAKSTSDVLTDQRGEPRPYDDPSTPNAPGGNGADIGSFERQSSDTLRAVSPYDFDGDGNTDIGIFRPAAGEWWINRSGDGQTFALQFGASTDKIVPADYTGDGKTDLAFFRPSSGEWYVLRSEDFSFFALPFGTNGDIPVPADYDADAKADFAVFRPSTGTWFVQRSGDNGTTIAQFGVNEDRPAAADYDGDARADLAIYRPSVGQWWVNRSTAGLIVYQFGNSADKIVQGDYTGDGKADVAFWRPFTGEWFVLRSEDLSYYSLPFGISTDMPAPGDYDGDGKCDTSVFRPSEATWYIQRSTAGTLIRSFGATGDVPIPYALVR